MAEGATFREKSEYSGNPHIVAIDVGTTSVRAHIYNREAKIVGTGSRNIELLYPQPGWVEMDENVLWQQVQEVVKEGIQEWRQVPYIKSHGRLPRKNGAKYRTSLTAADMTCIGITTQRNTFITWDKETGHPFHHFITWQDLRASELTKSWNQSFTLKGLTGGSKVLHFFIRKKRFLAASVLRFKTPAVSIRLAYQLEHHKELKKRTEEKQVMCGCIDTWLLWKLSGGQVFATDYSNASSTLLFDPFQMEWSSIVSGLLGVPLHILPELKDTSGIFGYTSPEIFGASIPITAMVADQQSAMFGQCCFNVGDIKCTMGTGTFMDCNTGNKPHASVAGLYPLVGWKIGSELVFIAEGFASDTGLCIEWAKSLGLFDDVSELEELVGSIQDTEGLYFVPAFSGLQAPINDDRACTSLIGLSPRTTKAHIVRAVLESLVFRLKLLHATILQETTVALSNTVRCDGGVTNNNFIMQLAADLLNCNFDRPKHLDMTSLGVAFLAGLAVGVWKDKEELMRLREVDKVFNPQAAGTNKYKDTLVEWNKAIDRCKHWHKHGKE